MKTKSCAYQPELNMTEKPANIKTELCKREQIISYWKYSFPVANSAQRDGQFP